MKQEPNKEMEILLRQLGRRDADVPFSGNGASGAEYTNHLDTDELSAYAENAVPAAARARYTEHIADCIRCRKLVSQLSLAAGLVVEEESAAVPASLGLKAFLASLFSPIVLRYAVPSLALLAVAFIGLMTLRQSSLQEARLKDNPANTIAQKQEQTPPPTALNQVERTNASQPLKEAENKSADKTVTKNGVVDQDSIHAERSAGDQNKREERPVDQIAAANEPPINAQISPAPKPEERVEVQKSGDAPAARRGAAPQPASAPATTATPTGLADSVEAKTEDKKMSKAPAKEENSAVVGGFGVMRKAKKEETRSRAKVAEAQEGERGRDRADKDEAETKSVAGRQFRKQGSVWVDVAYDSRTTVNLARGSEQYRALVADEPEIKTIADQLGGEVIVMWKGRAYRIR